MTPGIIVGGKIFGWFTATESACIAVLYAAVLSLLVYRERMLRHSTPASLLASRSSASVPPALSAGCSPITRFPRPS
jgi:TRAP-type C4-dicarboxylate transport system permease large subunit